MCAKNGRNKVIVFTGGGTAGHVTPNIALIKALQNTADLWQINYIGSKNGIERQLLKELNIPYFAIASGKLRRYFSWMNLLDPCKIIFGVVQAFFLCWHIKPQVVFSKGGFVAFPVVIAAWLLRIPVIIHESDLTPGLANKLCFPFARKICVTFAATARHFQRQDKVVITGTPIRAEFFHGDAAKGRELCGFVADKKVILVYGGSLGAENINRVVRQLLPNILDVFQVVHVCGKGRVATDVHFAGYKQFEYLNQEFPHVLAAADIVIARSGANSVYELLALRKPHILIPLGKQSSRGDQIENAQYCADLGYSEVIFEEDLSVTLLLEKIHMLETQRADIVAMLNTFVLQDSVNIIVGMLNEYAGK